ncbi:MAG TPA: class I SAM-dependent methyltransferase [Candidatus Babeliaceae bacterium]|nr:class I SAM-dependent methyltransferase [Candidatus Babeliaceae bacterium]
MSTNPTSLNSPTSLSFISSGPYDKKFKSRLIVGDGNFSYTLSLINKHTEKGLALAITATEYKKVSELDTNTLERLKTLQTRGVHLLFGIDATKLHETFLVGQFRRIHWNCPHPGNTNYQSGETRELVAKFFNSAAKIQNIGDRIHITLAQQKGQECFRQVAAYGIIKASLEAGYGIFKKRKFNKERYPEYIHQMTVNQQSCPSAERSVEFIFTKCYPPVYDPVDLLWDIGATSTEEKGLKKKTLPPGTKQVWINKYGVKEVISKTSEVEYLGSDSGEEDSSSYEDSDTEKEITSIGNKLKETKIEDTKK